MPLLPSTNVYVSPPRHTGESRSGGLPGGGVAPPPWAVVGNDAAQTGSGASAFVTVRSTPGRTVVRSVSVADVPAFLMFPVTVAVLMMVEPADCTTCPLTVISTVPPAFRLLSVHFAWGAATVHPPNVPMAPLVMIWLTCRLEASSPCVPSTITTSSARYGDVLVTRIL